MHRITRRSMLVLVVIGALVAGGAAYTDTIVNNSPKPNLAGYTDIHVANATLTDATYGLNSDGSLVDNVSFVFGQDLTGDKLQFGLGVGGATGALNNCITADNTDVVLGVFTSSDTADINAGVTTVTCVLATPVLTGSITDLNIAVTNN